MSKTNNRHLAWQLLTRVDQATMDRLTWYASERQQPLSVIVRDAVIEYLDTYMNAATKLGERYNEERQAHATGREKAGQNGTQKLT